MMMHPTARTLRTVLSRTVPTQGTRSMTTMNKQSAEEYKKQNYSSRQALTGRPVSPHVTIYAFPIGALTSISIRITGMALSVGALGLGGIELAGGDGAALAVMETIGSMGMITATTAKLAVAFPTVYHYLGACRHMMWDMFPETVNNATTDQSSKIMIGASIVLTSGLLML